jgi:hypothetical protein
LSSKNTTDDKGDVGMGKSALKTLKIGFVYWEYGGEFNAEQFNHVAKLIGEPIQTAMLEPKYGNNRLVVTNMKPEEMKEVTESSVGGFCVFEDAMTDEDDDLRRLVEPYMKGDILCIPEIKFNQIIKGLEALDEIERTGGDIL